MQNVNELSNDTASREIVISRLLNAPADLVYKVWTTPEHIAQWWGPNGFTNTIYKMDVRPGGEWRFMMHGPDGTDFPNKIVFNEVIPGKKLSYLHGADVEDLANDPHSFSVVVTFEAQGNKTLLTMRSLFQTAEARDFVVREFGAVEGGNQTVNRLEDMLTFMQGQQAEEEFVLTRIVNAPKELVFKVWTEPEHFAKWFGPAGFKIEVKTMDVKPGGICHYFLRAADGSEMWGKFMYREVVPSTKLVYTSSFSDAEANFTKHPMAPDWPLQMLGILELEDLNGKTKMTLRSVPFNATTDEGKAFKAGHAGMTHGWGGTMAQLDAYIATLA